MIRLLVFLVFYILLVPAKGNNLLHDSLKGDWFNAGYLRFHDHEINVIEVFDILDFGGRNDNLNSGSVNHDALMLALDACDTSVWSIIYFPTGYYRFKIPVNIQDRTKVIIVGAGSNMTQFIFHLDNQENMISLAVNGCDRVGIENLYITREDQATQGFSLTFRGFSSNCWVSGVESYKATAEHINLADCSNIDIIGCYIHHAWNYGGGGQAYGVTLYRGAQY